MDDLEANAVAACVTELEFLTGNARGRVLRYLLDRYAGGMYPTQEGVSD